MAVRTATSGGGQARGSTAARQTGRTAKSQARQTTRTAKREATNVLELVRDEAEELTNEARRQVDRMAGAAVEKLTEQRETQTHRVAAGIRSAGGQAQALARGDVDSAGMLGYYADAIGERLQAIAADLEERGPEAVLGDLDDFAQARPGAFLLGMGALGFALGRLVRAGTGQVTPESRSPKVRTTKSRSASSSSGSRGSAGSRGATGSKGRTAAGATAARSTSRTAAKPTGRRGVARPSGARSTSTVRRTGTEG